MGDKVDNRAHRPHHNGSEPEEEQTVFTEENDLVAEGYEEQVHALANNHEGLLLQSNHHLSSINLIRLGTEENQQFTQDELFNLLYSSLNDLQKTLALRQELLDLRAPELPAVYAGQLQNIEETRTDRIGYLKEDYLFIVKGLMWGINLYVSDINAQLEDLTNGFNALSQMSSGDAYSTNNQLKTKLDELIAFHQTTSPKLSEYSEISSSCDPSHQKGLTVLFTVLNEIKNELDELKTVSDNFLTSLQELKDLIDNPSAYKHCIVKGCMNILGEQSKSDIETLYDTTMGSHGQNLWKMPQPSSVIEQFSTFYLNSISQPQNPMQHGHK